MTTSTNTEAMAGYEQAIINLPKEAFLGSLLWFSISMADVNLDQARNELAALGMPDTGLRKVLRPVDAFRKASRDVGHKFKAVDNTRSELMVRPVGSDGDQAHRHLILERASYQAGQKRRVFYEKVGQLVFTRGFKEKGKYEGFGVEATITIDDLPEPLHPDELDWLTTSLGTFEHRFNHLLTHMDSHAVRSFVRDYIDGLDGVCVKESGGLYFVRQVHTDQVLKLGEWVRSIGSQFHSLDLLNLAEQRQMVLDAFQDETVAEAERLMAEIADILGDGQRQIEEKTFDAYALQAAGLSRRIAEYNDTLGMKADVAQMQVQMFTQQVTTLLGRVRQPGESRRKVA